jgi:Uma2 family endonuclease
MTAPLATIHPLTRSEYLALEQETGLRHEMVEGVAYAMVGGTAAHNIVAMNLAAAVHRGKGTGCHVFQQGMKLRVATDIDETFFYPDVMLCCDPADDHHLWRELPSFIGEVLSPSTAHTDFGAKLLLYRSIASLREYAVLGAEAAEVTLYRRSAGWKPLTVDLDASAELESAPVRLDFKTLYDGVTV